MADKKHLQAPWTLRINEAGIYVVGPYDGVGNPTICDIPCLEWDEETKTRAIEIGRLIEAAPDMVEVLNELWSSANHAQVCYVFDRINPKVKAFLEA